MAYSKEKYILYRERIVAAQKRYYAKTREARLVKQKEYDDANRDRIRERQRTYRNRNSMFGRVEVKNDLTTEHKDEMAETI